MGGPAHLEEIPSCRADGLACVYMWQRSQLPGVQGYITL